jgi:hypothetical protein
VDVVVPAAVVTTAVVVTLARARVGNARAVVLRVASILAAIRSTARSTARNVDTPDVTVATKFNLLF